MSLEQLTCPNGSDLEHRYLDVSGSDIEFIIYDSILTLKAAEHFDPVQYEKRVKDIQYKCCANILATTINAIDQVAIMAGVTKGLILTLLATLDNIQLQMDIYDHNEGVNNGEESENSEKDL